MEFKKGNKVKIINTHDIWQGKTGTVVNEDDDYIEVKINFETEDGIKSVIQVFDKTNLKLKKEDESLNEQIENGNENWKIDIDLPSWWYDIDEAIDSNLDDYTEFKREADEDELAYHPDANINDRDYIKDVKADWFSDFIWEDGKTLENTLNKKGCNVQIESFIDGIKISGEKKDILFAIKNEEGSSFTSHTLSNLDNYCEEVTKELKYIKLPIYFKPDYYGKDKVEYDKYEFDFEESLKSARKEKISESIKNKKTTKDIIHQYVYLEDLDGNQIPSWNFIPKIACAENVDENMIFRCAKDHNYKIFYVEAPGFCKEIVAAKEINSEDIQEQYGNFLEGKTIISEIKD